jgi:hypothetical protein
MVSWNRFTIKIPVEKVCKEGKVCMEMGEITGSLVQYKSEIGFLSVGLFQTSVMISQSGMGVSQIHETTGRAVH